MVTVRIASPNTPQQPRQRDDGKLLSTLRTEIRDDICSHGNI
jgi:hypothetical protein